MNEPIKVRLVEAKKQGRKIFLVLESDLYSYETFAVNPFYNEGDIKNQLQKIHFVIKVTECKNKIEAEVEFGNYLGHFTTGYTQLHHNLSTYYIDRKDQVINWVRTETGESFTDSRIKKVLAQWENDKDFYIKLKSEIESRKAVIQKKRFEKAESIFLEALENFKETALSTKF